MIRRPRGAERPQRGSDRDLYALVEEFFRTSFGTDNAVITEAVRRMLDAGGKRLRPRLTLLGAEASGGDASDHLPLASYMELIHVASLIHDDVVDGAKTRRGVNATAVDYGNRISVLAGDYLFAWIFKNVTANYDAPIPTILSSTLADITDGEVLQLQAVGDVRLPFSKYIEIVVKKTGSLFSAAAECGAIAAGGTPLRIKALRDFGLYFGIAFQMLDDMLDIAGDATALGKPIGNDLRERKVTVPLILALESDADRDFAERIERYYDGDDTIESGELVAGLIAAGGLARTREALGGYVERAKMSLAPLGAAPARAELAALADGLVRDSVARTR